MGKGMSQDVITKGIPDSVWSAVGVDTADQELAFMDTLSDFVVKGDGKRFADDIIHGAEALKQFNGEIEDALRIDDVTAEIQKFNAEMKNVDRVTRTMESSLGQAFSNMTTGASSVGDAFRNMAVSIFAEINKISSQNIARDIMAAVMPEGGTGQSFLKTLLTPKKQAGGIIKAQNGMYVSGSRTGDKNPAMLEDGEYVLNRNAVKAMGGAGALDSLNFNMAPRFAEGGGFSGFMGSVGKGLMMPFSLIGKLLSSIFGGGGKKYFESPSGQWRKPGRPARSSPATTHAAGIGTSIQSQREQANISMQSQAGQIMAELDALTAKGAGQAVSANRDDPKMTGIKRRAFESKQRRRLQAYKGIRPGSLGLPGQVIDGQWSGGRTHTISHTQASKHLTNLMHEGSAQGGPAALTPMLLELGNNPGMFDGMILGGVKFGPDVSILRKVAALQTMMEGRGIQFQTGGRLVSPIASSGVSSKGLDKILGKYAASSPAGGQGVAVGGGGGTGRMGITAPNLSGFAHSNDPTLQNVRGDIREWHNEQIQKKFEKQAKRDELMQTIVGAGLSAGISSGLGGMKGMMEKPPGAEGPQLKAWDRFKMGARGESSWDPTRAPKWNWQYKKGQRGGSIDNIPALLTGGEFVVNAPTVKRYGSGFFQKFQEGGLVGDQKFVPAEQKTAGDSKDRGTQKGGGSNTTINITINSSSGEGSTDTSGEPNTDERQMAVKIRDAVVSVIKQEKRTGGMLRDATAQDQ
jgi:hypothetical protein